MGSDAFCKQGARMPTFLLENPVLRAVLIFRDTLEANILKYMLYKIEVRECKIFRR